MTAPPVCRALRSLSSYPCHHRTQCLQLKKQSEPYTTSSNHAMYTRHVCLPTNTDGHHACNIIRTTEAGGLAPRSQRGWSTHPFSPWPGLATTKAFRAAAAWLGDTFGDCDTSKRFGFGLLSASPILSLLSPSCRVREDSPHKG